MLVSSVEGKGGQCLPEAEEVADVFLGGSLCNACDVNGVRHDEKLFNDFTFVCLMFKWAI